MQRLSVEQIQEIEYFGKATIDGVQYRYKDYEAKSEIYKGDKLFARINNRKPLDDPDRVEYVEE